MEGDNNCLRMPPGVNETGANATIPDKFNLTTIWRTVWQHKFLELLIASVMAAATVVITCLTWQQKDIIARQAGAAELDQRPWIGYIEIEPITFFKDDEVTFKYSFVNGGKTPTKGLSIGAKISTNEGYQADLAYICQYGAKRILERNAIYSAIPNTKFNISESFPDINTRVSLSKVRKDGVLIAGCIVYGSRFDEIPHQTGFVAIIIPSQKGDSLSVGPIYAISAN